VRISKELRDVLADAVKGFKIGLRPVFNQWGDGAATACMITSAEQVRGHRCIDKYVSSEMIMARNGWDAIAGNGFNHPFYQAGYRLGNAMRKLELNDESLHSSS
jgi:hypothetical protein